MADRNDALKDYKDGLSYKEIADKHGVSESTVKSWASRFWNKDKRIKAARGKAKKLRPKTKKSCNQNENDKLQVADDKKPEEKNINKGGAPPGNQNSKGHRNAEKHGGYSLVDWDVFDEEEKKIAMSLNTDEEEQLEEQLILYTIRERRILKAIESVKAASVRGKVEIGSNIGAVSEKDENTGQKKMKPRYTTSFFERDELAILRLEKELTSVQRNKTKVINSLADLRKDKGNNEDDWLDDFFSAVDEVNNEENES